MKLEKLRRLMQQQNIDYYVVPTEDFHGSEYVGAYFQERVFLSEFTGSAGTLLIGKDFAGLWTDGRYFLQAEAQLKDTGIMLMKMGEKGVPSLVEYLAEHLQNGMTLGFDGRCVTAGFVKEVENALGDTKISIAYEKDLVNEVWEERPELSRKPVWFLNDENCGVSRVGKIALMREEMKKKGADSLLLNSLDDVAWVFNMRGDDIAYIPVALAFALITEQEVRLFIQKEALNEEQEALLKKDGIVTDDYLNIFEYIKTLDGKTIWLNDQKTSYALMKNLPKEIKILKGMTPATYTKCVKNETERENLRRAHLKDGVAMTKFMYWLKKNAGKTDMTEISVQERLREFRAAQEGFIEESFAPISGYGIHGAIIHYNATAESNAAVKPGSFLLLDTGGQYMEGTTDITRTFALGEISEEAKRHFTTVLRANLRLGAVKFKEGCTGENLDMVARQPIWEEGLDFNHGTGHGVGYISSVHETPARISWKRREGYGENDPFCEGMLVSNEPGLYLEGKYGIRLENLILCRKAEKTPYGQFLNFETLTLVPFDLDGVDVTLLDSKERKLLNDYHSRVYTEISPYLTEEESGWLKTATRAI